MSVLRVDPPELVELLEDVLEVLPPEPDPEEPPELEPVEYFVDVLELEAPVFTSVPKSVQSEHTSSLAPSTLIVFGDDVSAPHISH
ncbi:hypothetical protein HALLA_12625 [Halostagnicola larsenii XH-48]|uniref:Uncharacterized protein n=1 Tax=Halostagnicola larsenii XH-48 TaxID=797299 RepID=W0JR94_9EURY|nr:hypothetical protein HALLA_12625 [Halostagnicola larsenii XH-48]